MHCSCRFQGSGSAYQINAIEEKSEFPKNDVIQFNQSFNKSINEIKSNQINQLT